MRDNVPFHEFFHGDNGAGLGASHQTGWTALVSELLEWCDGRQSERRPVHLCESLPLRSMIAESRRIRFHREGLLAAGER